MFRKHQKAMIAMVGVLCMIAFTILPIFLDQASSSGPAAGSNQVVARTARGEIREGDLGNMIERRQLANDFMVETLVAAMGEEFRRVFASRRPFGEPTERSVVETHLLAQRAKDLGVVIGDDAINAYLKDNTGDKVPADRFREIVRRLKTTQPQVFDALRTELAAEKLLLMSGVLEVPVSMTTPAQRWDYYTRLNSRATVELVPIRAEDFIDQIDDPDPKTLRAFFDAHKEQEPVPGSPEPGFKVPVKAAFQYVKASYDRFYDEQSVTDEQVAEYYEQFKDREFLYTDLGDSAFDAFDDPESSMPLGDAPKAEREDEPLIPEAESGVPGEQPDEPMGEESAAEQPDEPPPGEQPAGEAAEPAPDESSDNRSIENLLAFYQPPDDDQPATDADADQPAAGQPAAEAPDAPEGQASPPPATAADGASDDAAKPVGAKTEKLPAGPPPPISDDLLLPRDIRDGPKPKYEPLWKVEEAIRKRLAQQQADEKIEKALDAVKARMDRYERRWNAWSINRRGKEPARPDFAELAAAHALTDGKTSLVSRYDVALLDPELGGSQLGDYAFADVAIDYLLKYKSARSEDAERNRYLFWKIDEREAYVPELKEIQDEVVRAWKLIQARDPAKKKAAELVAKAGRAKESLAELYGEQGGYTIVRPPAFSWLTTTSAGVDSRAIPQISEVEGVEDAGEDFMRAVFRLQVGKVGSAMNQPQTVVYVIRVEKLDPPLSTLRQLFIAYPFSLYQTAALAERQQLIQAWLEQIRREAALEWVRPPDQRS
ncbi:MAG: SurA N-terminal domain-containing protein [Pirellulales bacterium]